MAANKSKTYPALRKPKLSKKAAMQRLAEKSAKAQQKLEELADERERSANPEQLKAEQAIQQKLEAARQLLLDAEQAIIDLDNYPTPRERNAGNLELPNARENLNEARQLIQRTSLTLHWNARS